MNVANIKFVENEKLETSHIAIGFTSFKAGIYEKIDINTGEIEIIEYDKVDGERGFAFYAPASSEEKKTGTVSGDIKTGTVSGDIWFNLGRKNEYENAAKGSIMYRAMIHEMGHALGLAHPFENGLPDNGIHALMNYKAPEGVGLDKSTRSPTGRLPCEPPMVWDILAIQALYGMNDTYQLSMEQ